MFDNITIVAIAIGAIFVALVVVSGLVRANRKIDEVFNEVQRMRDPDRGEIGRRLATEQRKLPEVVEVARPVAAAPPPVIWAGTAQQAERARRQFGLGPEIPAIAASRLALMAESSVCPQCAKQVKPGDDQYAVGIFSPRQRYHRECWEWTR